MRHLLFTFATAFALGIPAIAQEFKTETPPQILTPESTETRLGTLRFTDGLPNDETVKAVYDNLDFMRAVQVFLDAMPMASLRAMCDGLANVGAPSQVVPLTEGLLNARSILLTGNTTVVYAIPCIDLSDGPIVFDAPPGLLGLADDASFKYVTDIGAAGPDGGEGGKYLFLPPGYEGEVPEEGYFVFRSPSNLMWVPQRAFVDEAGSQAAADRLKQGLRIYHYADRENPPETKFLNISDVKVNTLHPVDGSYFRLIHEAIQTEPASAFDPALLGNLAALGIRKGEPFAPDARMQAIFEEAAAIGDATARSIVFAPRNVDAFVYDDRQWKWVFLGGSHEFMADGIKLHDAQTLFHFYATGITPAMVAAPVGSGTQYAYAERDSEGRFLDGSKTYRIDLPSPVPMNQFWSFTVYDNQTRSMLETDQREAGVDSLAPDLVANEDGSYTVWFGPEPPEGKEGNWVQTMPGKGWNTYFRLYGPLEPWFDKTWKLGDFELVE